MNKTILAVVIVAAICGLIIGGMWFAYSRADVQLQNKAAAQQKVCEAHFDKMWKIIKQSAGVTENYKESFKELYPKLMEGRYGNARGGALMSWIQERNPQLEAKVWTQLMSSIEAQRTSFFRDQQFLVDIKREHDNLRMQPPSKWFVNSPEIKITIIISAKTKAAYDSGEENDINLFGGKK